MNQRLLMFLRKFQFLRVTIFLISVVAISGCAGIPSLMDIVFGEQRQPATRTPLYVYRADLQLRFDGGSFDGIGVTAPPNSMIDIDVTSQVQLDRIEVETCARQDVCQNAKPCTSAFAQIDTDWFGKPGRHMVYRYQPSAIEREKACPIYIRVFDKQALAAWGYIAFRKDETLPAKFTCNGIDWKFSGHSVCQTRAGLFQQIRFDQDIEDFSVDPLCGVKRIDARTFEFRPSLGLCTGKFYANGIWHGMDLIAYEETLVRGA